VCICGSVSFSILLSSTADGRGESKSMGGRTVGIWTCTLRLPIGKDEVDKVDGVDFCPVPAAVPPRIPGFSFLVKC
jgi:hypothetical protein